MILMVCIIFPSHFPNKISEAHDFKKRPGSREHQSSKTLCYSPLTHQILVYIGVFGESSQKRKPGSGIEPPTTCLRNRCLGGPGSCELLPLAQGIDHLMTTVHGI